MFRHGDETACQFVAPPGFKLHLKRRLWICQRNLGRSSPKGGEGFFRADSGFFNGGLFDLLEEDKHEYLVKVKLKNLKDLLAGQTWQPVDPRTATCRFIHQCSGWRNPRMFYAVRIIKQMVEVDYFGEKQFVPEYEYFCYCSNLKGLDALQLHTLYGSRSESENWIEQTKNSLCAGKPSRMIFG